MYGSQETCREEGSKEGQKDHPQGGPQGQEGRPEGSPQGEEGWTKDGVVAIGA
jgi:hypothetical protein